MSEPPSIDDGANRQTSENRSSDPDDRVLVLRLRAGDPAAFAELMALYANALTRFAYFTVGSRDTADDVVQHVFVHLWERRDQLDPDCNLKPYLFRAIRNRALDEQSARTVRERYKTRMQTEADAGTLPSLVSSPEDDILTDTTIQAALDQLPDRRREALRLRLRESLNLTEIAEILGISPAAAQSLVIRALSDLRKKIWGA